MVIHHLRLLMLEWALQAFCLLSHETLSFSFLPLILPLKPDLSANLWLSAPPHLKTPAHLCVHDIYCIIQYVWKRQKERVVLSMSASQQDVKFSKLSSVKASFMKPIINDKSVYMQWRACRRTCVPHLYLSLMVRCSAYFRLSSQVSCYFSFV